MFPSATLCRTQQAYHRERSRTALLDNARNVANHASIAWGKEAEIAEYREARRIRTREIAGTIAAGKLWPVHDADDPSENPDRIVE